MEFASRKLVLIMALLFIMASASQLGIDAKEVFSGHCDKNEDCTLLCPRMCQNKGCNLGVHQCLCDCSPKPIIYSGHCNLDSECVTQCPRRCSGKTCDLSVHKCACRC